jgi:hypothetical protein
MPNHRRFAASAAAAFVLGFAGASAQASPTCPVDWNNDGVVNSTDVSDFINSWFEDQASGTLVTDFDLNGVSNSTDVSMFINAWFNGCGTQTELAADPAASYPFAAFVRAFNTGANVSVAIDPARFPAIAGVSANVYVVADKSPQQWALDSTLTDVRAGGPTLVNFGSTDIQSCTFTLAGTNTLASDAGTGIGVPYDLVIDVNGNGILDTGDFCDAMDPKEAGFYVVKNLTTAGPLAVTTISTYTVSGPTAGFTSERAYYPTNIASMGQLPLIVISHGNGHNYTWYDYLGQHLASYGYIVMVHQNNTGPGIETCTLTTLQHTDAFIGQQATIAGGVFNGHVDGHTIVWIGHSRGGEGVARAYDRVFDHNYVPTNFVLSDIKLVSSIAPTDFLGFGNSDPHGVRYNLIYGAADGDVCGCPDSPIAQSFIIYERATQRRNSTYLNGASHNDFNCCGFADGTGPSLLGRPAVQLVAKIEFLALIKSVLENNVPARDFLWRQWEQFRPAGAPAAATVFLDYHDADPTTNRRVVDDFQTNAGTNLNSAGGAVTTDVLTITEGQLHDTDSAFTTGPAFNGFTRTNAGDLSKGTVFNWTTGTPRFYRSAIPAAMQDVSGFDLLSFRAAQQTRHADTVALPLGNLNFTVTLVDADGNTSAVSTGWQGGAFDEPYQRTGYGTGTGWQAAFETVRFPLEQFKTNGRTLDLTRITEVRFDFGPAFGNDRGRIGLDDIEFVAK